MRRRPLREVLSLLKALADEARLRAFASLSGGELCLCQIVALLELAPSTVSKHMSILRSSGLVESVKRGRWVYYRHAGRGAADEVRLTVSYALEALEGSDAVRRDRARLREIRRLGAEEVCCVYLGKEVPCRTRSRG